MEHLPLLEHEDTEGGLGVTSTNLCTAWWDIVEIVLREEKTEMQLLSGSAIFKYIYIYI